MAKILKEKIVAIEEIASSIFKMTIKSDYVSQNAMPGQFVNIRCGEGLSPLLRRPVSICDVDRYNKSFDIVFQVRGAGTAYLSKMKPGSLADIIAPLGRAFEISNNDKKIAVLGGGIGVFPLLFLLKETAASEKTAFLGFRNKQSIVMFEEFNKASDNIRISTDDGSEGYHGLITDLLEAALKENRYDVIYTCGPMPMMKKAVEAANRHEIKCQVSLEQRMGCGIGACLVCACKTRLGDEWEYSHVCKDGPVFWSDEVVFEE